MISFRWSMVFFVFSMGAMMMVNGDVFDGQLDLIVIVDHSSSAGPLIFDQIKHSLQTIPDQFPFGPNRTRAAVIFHVMTAYSDPQRILIYEMTDDAEKFKKTVANMSQSSMHYFADGMIEAAVSEIVKSDISRPNVPKAVILITHGDTSKHNKSHDQAEIIRKKIGDMLFVVIDSLTFKNQVTPEEMASMKKLAGVEENLKTLDNFSDLTAVLFTKATQRNKCPYSKVCRYKDSSMQECVGEWAQQSLDNPAVDCSKYAKPTTVVPCDMTNCTELCDSWKWKAVHCQNSTCGRNLTIPRVDIRPGWKPKFDNCLNETKISCEPCTTERPQTEETHGFPLWAIGLIIAIVLLILLAVAIAMIMRRRRTRRAAAAADAALKAKIAAAAAAKKSPKSIGGKSMKIPKPPVAASGYGMEFSGFGGQKAEQSVAANLIDDRSTLKRAGMSGQSKIKPPPPSSSANVKNMKMPSKSVIKK